MQQLYCVLNIKTTISKIVFSIFFVAMIVSSCTTVKNEDAIQSTSTIESTPIVFSQQTGIPATNSIITATTYPQMTATSMAAQSDDSILDILLPNCYGEGFSPDREWVIGYCGYDETWIIRVDQTAKWTMSYGEYYGKKFNSGEGIITPEYWTADGKYLYLAIQRGVSGPIYFANAWALIRLNLENGQFSEILKPLQHGFYSFSLDGENLAYIYQYKEPLTFNVVNLKNGNSKSVALSPEYSQAGEIIWSSDKSKVALAQASVDNEGNNPDLFSVAIIDLENRSLQTIISDTPLQMLPKLWLDDNKIELVDIEGKSWIFDFTNNSLYENPK